VQHHLLNRWVHPVQHVQPQQLTLVRLLALFLLG
jgi:hypothetical protein